MRLSIISPMYNEEENIEGTIREIRQVLTDYEQLWELILVNDGSTDRTLAVATKLAEQYPNVIVLSYPINRGRGYALRTGFAHAKGALIITLESDLSYDPITIAEMAKKFEEDKMVDMLLASPYMKGGRAENVPFKRLAISKLGNKILGLAMGGNFATVTQMFRGYRRKVIESLELEADRKEIHLEILSKSLAAGYCVQEIPAFLRWRATGSSKFKFRATTISHLLFSFYEKPSLLFGLIGLAIGMLGLLVGVYIIILWQQQTLNPTRPLMTLLILLIVSGLLLGGFGFIGTQIVALRKEIIKVQRENRCLEKLLKEASTQETEEGHDLTGL